DSAPDVSLKGVALLPGQIKDDPTFGQVEVYYGSVQIPVTSNRSSGPAVNSLDLRASYQGCNDPTGVCYPPREKPLSVALVDTSQLPAAPDSAIVVASEQSGTSNSIQQSAIKAPVSETSLVGELFAKDNA